MRMRACRNIGLQVTELKNVLGMNWWKPEKMECGGDRRLLLREQEEPRTKPGHSLDQDTILHLAAGYTNDFTSVKQP